MRWGVTDEARSGLPRALTVATITTTVSTRAERYSRRQQHYISVAPWLISPRSDEPTVLLSGTTQLLSNSVDTRRNNPTNGTSADGTRTKYPSLYSIYLRSLRAPDFIKISQHNIILYLLTKRDKKVYRTKKH